MEKVLGKTTMAQEDPLFSMLQGLASSMPDGEELLFGEWKAGQTTWSPLTG